MLGKQGQGKQYLIYQHNIPTLHSLNHPKVNISQLKIIDQDRKQVSREAMHLRKYNPALIQNIGKLNIPKIFNQILGLAYNTSSAVSTNSSSQQNPSSNHSNRATNLHN